MPSRPIALVTGANRGIGRETAKQLAQEHGYQVVLGSRDAAKGQAAAQAIGKEAVCVRLDVSDAASITAAVAEVTAQFGRLDCLINNAGVDYDTDQMVTAVDMDRVHRTFATNLFGPWHMDTRKNVVLRVDLSEGCSV
ncbi:MAG: SDR family NAD(P)-dependent oxidoreductase, partial [Rhodospirillaceae bacterium]